MADYPYIVGAIETSLASDSGPAWGEGRLHLSDLGYSSTGGGCKRALWLRLQGAEQSAPSAGMRWMWQRGHDCEAAVLAALEKSLGAGWRVKGSQVKCEFLGIKGTLDILLEHEDGTKCVIDCKTMRGNAASHRRQSPKLDNVLQVSAYALGAGADLAGLIYVDREGQNGFIQWSVIIDNEVNGVVVDKQAGEVRLSNAVVVSSVDEIKLVQEMTQEPPILRPLVKVNKNKGPDSVFLKEPWQCSYCAFRDVSCQGAIQHIYRRELPDTGLIGHVQPDGSIKPRAGVAPVLADIAKENMP